MSNFNNEDIEKKLDELIASQFETEVTEFKEAKNSFSFDELGQYFSALSNEANLHNKNCAWLIFGIEDKKHKIVGTKYRNNDKELNSLKEEIARQTSENLTFIEIYKCTRKDAEGNDKRVLLFQIPPAPKGIPIAFKRMYYGRDGESLVGLSIEKIERIRSQSKSEDWSAKLITEASIEDLDSDAIQFARHVYIQKNPKLAEEVPTWDDQTFLNKAKLTINGKITNTAIVLLGKSESEHYISPATSKITWILKDKDGIEKDYEHFTCPLILSIQEVYKKIRNIKYRYIAEGNLFPDEVQQYDPYTIREALNNCIAHQDYTMGGKIILIEKEDGELIFSNSGDFIPSSIEDVIKSDAPENRYRNSFLANAMVNLNMIDTIGSGIKKLFNIQRDKFFPLPEYDLSDHKVKVTITGKVLDSNYARKLAEDKTLSLFEIMLLDKVQKNKKLTNEEYKLLKSKNLIEGKRNNYFISSTVAEITNQKPDYMKLRGINDDYCKKIIIDYIKKFKTAKKADLEEILLEKLGDSMTDIQKKNKIKNILQSLRRDGVIEPHGKEWILCKK
ncbi:MAG: putative DNA binding domain-containing protein [Candidatus Treponema excrementipullorum]|uniref:DNA binding domain-containing protein n=1 Tax=Candidatus Treponema excrementipullorum TaxID=2838768 RepID=A0A9E2NZ55_9SPIR|nr:putative DNA binding domain-containing protein [Candidatus Treponema excrementipullorum]